MTVSHDRIRGLQASLTNGSLSSVSLLEWDAPGPDPAFISLDPEGALISASTSDALRERGYVPSLIAGLPVSIKDLFDVKGQTTTAGSRVLAGAMPAPRDGTAVARLREAGAVFVGRTNMSEFAFSGLGVNPHFGTPINPFDATRVAGGSSSGAAASVASGRVAFALGTDTGGSLRIPASFCGLTAFKPTARRIACDGVLPLSRSFDSVGAIARSVDCCAIVDAILSGEALEEELRSLRGLRFGVTHDVVGQELENPVREAFEGAIAMLRDAGATVELFSFPELQTAVQSPLAAVTAIEAWAWHRVHVGEHGALYDPRVLKRLRLGEERSAADYLDLLKVRNRLIESAWVRLAKFDAWLMPTVATVAPTIASLVDDDTFFATNARVLRNPSVVNFIDGCALNIPCVSKGQLPVGISLCGTSMTDKTILSIGRSVEALFDAHRDEEIVMATERNLSLDR